MSVDDAHEHFWSLAAPLLAEPAITRGTMMGFPCLRVDGQFFASVEHKGTRLVVKMHRDRVAALVAAGDGEAFAPAGRTFKEWVAIPYDRRADWPERLVEARAFVGG